MSMLSEIHEQAGAVSRMVEANLDRIEHLVALLSGDVTHVLIAARGTSDNAARYAQYVWGARNRLTVGLATPSLYGPYASPPSLVGSLVVGISQSGQSPDLVEVLREARRQQRPTLAISNDPDSPMAQAADVVIELAAGTEYAVAATKTYTTQLAAVALSSLAMSKSDAEAFDGLPDLIGEVLATGEDIANTVERMVGAERCVVLGRGFHYATAHEWALKLQELTYVHAQPYSAVDFLHGPSAVVDEGFPILLIATSGPAYDPLVDLATDMRSRGAYVLAISDRPDMPCDELITIPTVDEWLSPIVAAPALQLFCHSLTIARGIDPETPRGLTKVTRTR